jgi:hypothetical protein
VDIQGLAHPRAGPVQRRLDRAEWNVQGLRDLGVRQLGDREQQQDIALDPR